MSNWSCAHLPVLKRRDGLTYNCFPKCSQKREGGRERGREKEEREREKEEREREKEEREREKEYFSQGYQHTFFGNHEAVRCTSAGADVVFSYPTSTEDLHNIAELSNESSVDRQLYNTSQPNGITISRRPRNRSNTESQLFRPHRRFRRRPEGLWCRPEK
jgi:hypothetical protein